MAFALALAWASALATAPAHEFDGLARLPDRFGEGLLLIEVPPLAALVQLHEMTQCPARGEKLPLGMFVLHFGSQGLRHCASLTGTRKKTSKTGLVICLYDGDNATEGAQGGWPVNGA